jgi:hypothetical protein
VVVEEGLGLLVRKDQPVLLGFRVHQVLMVMTETRVYPEPPEPLEYQVLLGLPVPQDYRVHRDLMARTENQENLVPLGL